MQQHVTVQGCDRPTSRVGRRWAARGTIDRGRERRLTARPRARGVSCSSDPLIHANIYAQVVITHA